MPGVGQERGGVGEHAVNRLDRHESDVEQSAERERPDESSLGGPVVMVTVRQSRVVVTMPVGISTGFMAVRRTLMVMMDAHSASPRLSPGVPVAAFKAVTAALRLR